MHVAAPVCGLFVCYVVHDALQERAFRTEGFRFGWWMTLNELVVVSLFAFVFEWSPEAKSERDDRKLRVDLAFDILKLQ